MSGEAVKLNESAPEYGKMIDKIKAKLSEYLEEYETSIPSYFLLVSLTHKQVYTGSGWRQGCHQRATLDHP